jgi:hypothetical protein
MTEDEACLAAEEEEKILAAEESVENEDDIESKAQRGDDTCFSERNSTK